MSPHVLMLILVPIFFLAAFVFYRIRPRAFMKIIRWLDGRSGGVIIVIGMLVLILGFWGFATVDRDESQQETTSQTIDVRENAIQPVPGMPTSQEDSDPSSKQINRTSIAAAIYETFQIFAFNANAEVLEKSILLSIAMILAVFLATIIASKGIAVLFRSSYEELGLRFKSMHVVVCGLGRIGRQVVADLEEMHSEFQIVVVEPDPENKNIPWAREMGAVVLIGDATQADMLEAARVQRAREVFVVTGSDECNIESVIEIRDILHRKGRKGRLGQKLPRLKCHVHILNQDLAGIVREKAEMLERSTADGNQTTPGSRDSEMIDIEVFNALERTARRLLEDIAIKVYSRLTPASPSDGHGDRSPPQVLHYFLFGFGDFGQTLALKIAELSHFATCKRNRMTIFDTRIEQRSTAFVSRHPTFCPAIEPAETWEFDPQGDEWGSKRYRPNESSRLPDGSPGIEYVCNARFDEYRDIVDEQMLRQMIACCETGSVQPVVLVCFEEDRENFARAERLQAKLNSLGKSWPIFVWIPRNKKLSKLLAEQKKEIKTTVATSCEIIPFGECYGNVSYNELKSSWVDWLARHVHLVWMEPTSQHWTSSIGRLKAALEQLNLVDHQNSDSFETTTEPSAGSSQPPHPNPNVKILEQLSALDWPEIDRVSKLAWDTCEEWERASNRSCAAHAVLKAAALGHKITGYSTTPKTSNPNASHSGISAQPISISSALDENLRQMEHYRWVAERLLTGWHYAENGNKERKTRWQITPWSQLDTPPKSYIDEQTRAGNTVNEKAKDAVIVKLVVALLKLNLLESNAFEE
ncbi:MAG: NAD-binding protein [Pirellulaceae bacterium]|nr:NAD-binding protein [Pirellulaceae bacterium]